MKIHWKFSLVALVFFASCQVFAQDQFSGDAVIEEDPFILTDASDVEAVGDEMSAEQQEYMTWAKSLWDSLDRKTGKIEVGGAGATLNVPEEFYYLDSKDANTVLVEAWGNPPGRSVLGMLFPAEYTPFDDESWAVTIEYEEDGYVSDGDADKIDYTDLLKQMKADVNEESQLRVSEGFEPITLVGWAAEPYYDAASHKLHWAKELKFGDNQDHTLNYNIRVLGRKGVLVLNFIAGMNQKEIIEQKVDSVLALANFEQGSKYEDFDPELDKVAAYGIGALVAGKLAAKVGLLGVILIFLKKFGVLIVVALAAIGKKLYSRKKD